MYETLCKFYEKNKNKNWKTWLMYNNTFGKPGKQGLVGTLKFINQEGEGKDEGKDKDMLLVFKMSQYINYLVNHESSVMKGLNDLGSYCPHFCRFVGKIESEVDPSKKKNGNPFNQETKYSVKKEILLCEYLKNSSKFYNYIKSPKINDEILFSTIKQILLALVIAQKKKFSHYDLHSCNIMMKKCDKDLVFLYKLDDDNKFVIPTFGHYPIIIDFGFSYIENMDDGPLWQSMAHTDVGFMSDRFDWVADPKLFLISTSKEIAENRKDSKNGKILRKIVKNIFGKLSVDWESGWDKPKGKQKVSVSDYVLYKIRKYNKVSMLFDKYDHYCLDLIQSLIIIPLSEQPIKFTDVYYKTFLKEWVKIETQISNPFYNIYVLKGVVDNARFVMAAYYDTTTRQDAITTFKNGVLDIISSVAKFCRPKNVDYEKLICSLYLLSRSIEGIMHQYTNSIMDMKQKNYKNIPLNSTAQIYGAIEANIKDPYVYTKRTKICIFDRVKKYNKIFTLSQKQIDSVNKTHHLAKGMQIYNFFENIDL